MSDQNQSQAQALSQAQAYPDFDTNVVSSNVQHLKYDSTSRTLIVTFKNGKRYQGSNISPELADSILNSESIGLSIRSLTLTKLESD